VETTYLMFTPWCRWCTIYWWWTEAIQYRIIEDWNKRRACQNGTWFFECWSSGKEV